MPNGRSRRELAALLLGVVFLAGILIGLANKSPDAEYGVAALSATSRLTLIVCPVVAAWSAMRIAAILRYVNERVPTRSRAHVYLQALRVPILGGGAIAALALTVGSGEIASDSVEWTIVGMTTLWVVVSSLFGASLALILPRVLALPLSAVLVYAWVGLLMSTDWVRLRYLSGSFATCCTLDQVPAPAMLIGSAFFGVVVAAVCVAGLFVARRRLHTAGVLGVGVCFAILAGGLLVTQRDSSPELLAVSSRTAATTCLSGDVVTLCAWPEHGDLLDDRLEVVGDTYRRLRAAAVPGLSTTFTESQESGSAGLTLAREARPADTRASIVQEYLPDPSLCRFSVETGYARFGTMYAWLLSLAGLSRSEVELRADPEDIQSAAKISRSTSSDKARYLATELSFLRESCG